MADLRDADKLILTGSGSLTAQDQAVTLTLNGQSNATFQLTGTWSATVTFEASNDNSAWTSMYALQGGSGSIGTTATANAIYRCAVAGFGYIRARCSAYTSGTIVITALAVSGTSGVFQNFPLPTGTNAIGRLAANDGVDIGDVTINNASLAVTNTGTFAVQVDGNALTSLQLIDDVVYTDDTSAHSTGTSKGALIMAAATPTDGSVNANDIGAVAMTTDRKLHVSIQDALPAGTAAIGKLAANSGVDIGDVDVTSLPALASGTNLIGRTSSSDETSTVYNGTTALTPKFAAIDAATSGDNTLVSAVSSKKIRVLSLFLVAAGTVNARFESGAGGTALTGQMNLVANSGFVLPYNPVGWFETASNTLLNLELSAAISCDGSLTYVEV